MSDFDRNATLPYGGRAGRAGVAIDQGLRSYMLGVYNNMVLGLAITGLVALGVSMITVTTDPSLAAARFGNLYLTSTGVALYGSPLRYVVMLAPLAFIFFFQFRIDKMSASSARSMFLGFSAVMGLSLSSILLVYTKQSVALAFLRDVCGLRRAEASMATRRSVTSPRWGRSWSWVCSGWSLPVS